MTKLDMAGLYLKKSERLLNSIEHMSNREYRRELFIAREYTEMARKVMSSKPIHHSLLNI